MTIFNFLFIGDDMLRKYYNLQTILLVFLLLFTISSCSKKETEKNSSTNEKIVLKIHAWEGYAEEYVEDFKNYIKKEFNIDVELKITKTNGLDSFIEAIKKDKVHIISPANDLLKPLKKENLIIPLEISRIPKYRQINQSVLKKKAHEIGGIVYAVPFNFGPYGIAYNKDKVISPKSYKIFWEPKYKKRVSISGDYDTINIYMTALSLGYDNIFNLNDIQLKQVEIKLKELCKNQISEFWDANLNPANHDKYDLGMDWGIGVMQINDKYGKNWGFTIPDEKATGWLDTWALSINTKNSDIKKIAYEFINFMISPKVQAKMAKLTTYAPVNPYAGRYLNAKEKERYYLIDPNYINEFILWQPLKAEVLKKYQELWKRVKNAK